MICPNQILVKIKSPDLKSFTANCRPYEVTVDYQIQFNWIHTPCQKSKTIAKQRTSLPKTGMTPIISPKNIQVALSKMAHN